MLEALLEYFGKNAKTEPWKSVGREFENWAKEVVGDELVMLQYRLRTAIDSIVSIATLKMSARCIIVCKSRSSSVL